MTQRQTGDDDGSTAPSGTESSTGHARFNDRQVPERSRTISNGELSRDKTGERTRGLGGPGGLQYATTAPNGAMSSMINQFGNNSNNGRMGISRSEDGHSSNRLHQDSSIPPLPTSSNMGTLQQSQATLCAACGAIVTGQFVRALGVVFHKACFTCNVSPDLWLSTFRSYIFIPQDCHSQVAQKFFPVDGPDGKQYPLCEVCPRRSHGQALTLLCRRRTILEG